MDINQNILKKSTALLNEMISHRRLIHQNPELSFEEFETSKYIQNVLKNLKIKFEVVSNTGVVATIGSGKKCVALRADIDALPITEETGFDFASKNSGIMHACGHDLHIAMLLGAAEILKENEKELDGIVKLIFQPAEEKLPGGASKLIKDGALKNPVPSCIFGCHVYPEALTGTVSVSEGNILASADELYITIKGKGAHAAQPHLCNDVILTASELIIKLQSLISKERNPLTAGVLSITSIHGGSATNIFPDEIKLMGTFRTFDENWRRQMHGRIESLTKKLCESNNVKAEIRIEKGYPSLYNNPEMTKFIKSTAENLFGKKNVLDFTPKMWAEDFAYYSEKIPAVFWFLGVKSKNEKQDFTLHNSKFRPDESAMINGAAMLVSSAVNALKI